MLYLFSPISWLPILSLSAPAVKQLGWKLTFPHLCLLWGLREEPAPKASMSSQCMGAADWKRRLGLVHLSPSLWEDRVLALPSPGDLPSWPLYCYCCPSPQKARQKHKPGTEDQETSSLFGSPFRRWVPEWMKIVELQPETESLAEITGVSPPNLVLYQNYPGPCFAKHPFPREGLTHKVQGEARQV